MSQIDAVFIELFDEDSIPIQSGVLLCACQVLEPGDSISNIENNLSPRMKIVVSMVSPQEQIRGHGFNFRQRAHAVLVE